jgi:hypothetical protein
MINNQHHVAGPAINSFSQVPNSNTTGFAPSNSAMSASREFHILRLLQIRQEAQALEESHALIKQHEQRMLVEIMKRRASPQQDSLNNMLRFNEHMCFDLPREVIADSSATSAPAPQKEANIVSAASIDQNQKESTKELVDDDNNSPVEKHEKLKEKTDEKKQAPQKKTNRVKRKSAKKMKIKDKPKIKDQKWLNTLEQLKEYKEQEGNCIVPRGESAFSRFVESKFA